MGSSILSRPRTETSECLLVQSRDSLRWSQMLSGKLQMLKVGAGSEFCSDSNVNLAAWELYMYVHCVFCVEASVYVCW